jgi:peptidoglycan/LPS O-acetylase OafA/YrhL
MMTPLMHFTDRLGWVRLPVLIVLTTLVCAFFYRVVEVPARRAIVDRWAG